MHKLVNDAQGARSKRSTRDKEQKKHKGQGAKEAQDGTKGQVIHNGKMQKMQERACKEIRAWYVSAINL